MPNSILMQMKNVFSSFSANDLKREELFYKDILGLSLTVDEMGISLRLPGNCLVFIYPKPDHQPASFTVLNFEVDNIDETVKELSEKGIKFEHYTGDIATDEKGILRGIAKNMGPDIAWFKDPAGNILSILQEAK